MAAKSCRKIDILVTATQIMRVIRDAKAPVNITEVSRATGYSVDVVFRQLGTLYDERWVEKIGDGYVLGPEMYLCKARVKAQLEARRDEIDKTLTEMEE